MSKLASIKQEYRNVMRRFRRAIPGIKLIRISESIQRVTLGLISNLDPDIVHCYLSSEANYEVRTDIIIESLLHSDKQLVVPRIKPDMIEFDNVLISPESTFFTNKWGVKEPADGRVIEALDVELVLVPLLCADRNGRRIGYGKGFYDRFLNATAAIAIGLCPEDCLFDQIPYEEHDKPLDYIITEKRILRITI
jgi:5-formyltetrahydrofolate cyclo-ligase